MKRKVPRTLQLGCALPSDLATAFAKTIAPKKKNENKKTKLLNTTQIFRFGPKCYSKGNHFKQRNVGRGDAESQRDDSHA